MPQKTNLNINPYYDDFSKDSNFYKVLFNPGKACSGKGINNFTIYLTRSD
jgi:hypothetical protein